MIDLTFVSQIDLAWQKADRLMSKTADGEAKREFALAKTALEDAQMRFSRGLARVQGKFQPVDLETEA